MRMLDFSNTQTPAPVYEAPTAGAYVIGITGAEAHDDKSYLDLEGDILDGPYKGYYTRWRAEHPDWRDPLHYRRYYTPRALGFFKRFCDAVSRSNGNFVFDGAKVNHDERTLVGKRLGVVLQAVEYYTNSGDLRTRLEILREIPIDRVPYEPVPPVLTIAKQEEIKARREARKQGATPAPAPAAYAQPAQAPAQAFAQAPAPAPAYQQATQPAQAVARQTAATPAYTQTQQQPAQQAYTQNPALAQFVDVSGSMEEMPFM